MDSGNLRPQKIGNKADQDDYGDARADDRIVAVTPSHSTAIVGRHAPLGVTPRLLTLEPRIAAIISQYYYCKLSHIAKNYGCEAKFSVHRPRVEKGDHSLLQFIVWNDESGVTQTIEAGWSREGNDPDNNNPNRNESRLFVYYTNSGYTPQDEVPNVRGYIRRDPTSPTGWTAGWTQRDPVFEPEKKLPYSHIGQTPQELALKIQLVSDRWYLTTGTGRVIGYFECALFRNQPDNTKTLGDHSSIIMFQGEVFDNSAPRPADTTTDMGSGKFSVEGWERAAYIRNMKIQTEATVVNPGMTDLSTAAFEKKKASSWDATIVTDAGWGSAMYLGGPGATQFDWLDWETIGGHFLEGCPITAISRKEGQIDAFVCGRDGNVYTSFCNDDIGWANFDSQWIFIGGNFPPGTRVTAISRQPEIIDLFICSGDKKVYTSYWTPDTWWSGAGGWRSLEGGTFPAGAPVTALARSGDNLDLFVYDTNGSILTTAWQDGADWTGIWGPVGNENLGMVTAITMPTSFTPTPQLQPIGAVRRKNQNEMMLFACGDDGVVYTIVWTPEIGWVGDGSGFWQALGSAPGGANFQGGAPVTAVSRKEGNVDIFLCADDGNVYTTWWTSEDKWNAPAKPWTFIGGKSFDAHYPVVAVSRLEEQLDVFACSKADGQPYTSWWPDPNTNDWSGLSRDWKGIPGDFQKVSPASSVAVVAKSIAGNRLEMLIVDHLGVVNQTMWAG